MAEQARKKAKRRKTAERRHIAKRRYIARRRYTARRRLESGPSDCWGYCYWLVFAALLLLFGIQDGAQDYWKPMQYLDEGIALLTVPLGLLRWRQKKVNGGTLRPWLPVLIPLGIFLLSGWVGVVQYHYQPISNVLKDFYTEIKFFLTLGTGYLLFQPMENFEKFYERLWRFANVITVVLALLCAADLCFGIFYTETRYGLPAIKLFYDSYTALVAFCFLLAAIYLRLYEYKGQRILLPMGLLFFVMINTRRSKALAAMVLIFLVYRLVFRKGKRMSRKILIPAVVCVGIAVVSVVWRAFYYYYKWGTDSARLVLTMAAPYIAKDYFPFGTGWATYGSWFSAEPYSPIYTKYGLDAVWGLSPNFHDFVSDTFWPMILAESGVVGFAAYVTAIFFLLRKLMKRKAANIYRFASELLLIAYLLAASVNDTAFANPLAVPFAFWIGLMYAEATRNADRPAEDLG